MTGPGKIPMMTKNIVNENLEKIRVLFPNCVTEVAKNGESKLAVDFDKLKQELSESVIEGAQERYSFTWPDKSKAIILANSPTTKTLRPIRKESVNFDNTRNIYIEGDNLDALKCIRESYFEKVKIIYIDPPYNTGSDLIYHDDFKEDVKSYLQRGNLIDEEGNRLITNTESNGRFHTSWLNMMYPRLKLSRDLLTPDGAIVISIDDHEVDNLKKVCNEIFGESNFVATFPWRKRTAKSDVPFGVSQDFEWIVVYAKSDKFSASVLGKERKYYHTDDFPGRPWRIHDCTHSSVQIEL